MIEMSLLFGAKDGFYKVNLHCHSLYSDGDADVYELKKQYKARGYSAVAFTDHEHIINNTHLNDDDFIALVGYELAIKSEPSLSTLKSLDMRVAHLNLYAKDQTVRKTPFYSSVYDHFARERVEKMISYDGESPRELTPEYVNRLVREAHEAGFLVSYNHPSWSLQTARDYLDYDGFDFVEVYNHSCYTMGYGADEQVFDQMLRAGKRVFATATDDNHNRKGFDGRTISEQNGAPVLNKGVFLPSDSFGGWVVVNADGLEYGKLIDALENGDFYASTGPQIHSISLKGNLLRIACSPAKRISLLTATRKCVAVFAKDGGSLSEAEFEMKAEYGFVRIRIEDESGKFALSQAYPIREI